MQNFNSHKNNKKNFDEQMNIRYKINQSFLQNPDRVKENIILRNTNNDFDVSEFIQIYQNLSISYQNQIQSDLEEALHTLATLVIKNSIPTQANDVFEDLHIPYILIDIVFIDYGLPKNCIEDAVDSINYLLVSDVFFQKSFQNAGILDFLIDGINVNTCDWDHISLCIEILVSLVWKNDDLSANFFSQFHYQISQLINAFFNYSCSNASYDKHMEDLQIYITNFIYVLSFSISSEEEAIFMYTYVDTVLLKKQENENYQCNPLYILYILFNISCYEQILDSIYGNKLIECMMNDVFSSEQSKSIHPAIGIVHILIEKGYDVSDKFSLYNFFRMIDIEDNIIVERAADFICHSLTNNPLNPELRLIGNTANYFVPAYERGDYCSRYQLIQALFLIIREVDINVLRQLVKFNLVRILIEALDFEEEDIIVNALQYIVRIMDIEPVFDSFGNNIVIDDIDNSEIGIKIQSLDYTNARIYECVRQFTEKYDEIDEENEEDDRF